jgi:hypothetical protein
MGGIGTSIGEGDLTVGISQIMREFGAVYQDIVVGTGSKRTDGMRNILNT